MTRTTKETSKTRSECNDPLPANRGEGFLLTPPTIQITISPCHAKSSWDSESASTAILRTQRRHGLSGDRQRRRSADGRLLRQHRHHHHGPQDSPSHDQQSFTTSV